MSKEFTTGLIEMYRTSPCLWQVTHKDYTNKNLKNAAYEKMFRYGKRFERDCTIVDIKKKIQNLRTTFRKELKKVEWSKTIGNGAEDVYTPSLWYYDLLLFIRDTELPRQSTENIKNDDAISNNDFVVDEETEDGADAVVEQEPSQRRQTFVVEESHARSDVHISQKNHFESPNTLFVSQTQKQGTVRKREALQKSEDDLLQTCTQSLKEFARATGHNKTVDEFDAATISWATKLRKLRDFQKILKASRNHKRAASKKRKALQKLEEDFLNTCTQSLKEISSPTRSKAIDEFDAVTIAWATKLRRLSEVQKVLSEDLISQVLKKAFFGELTRSTTLHDPSSYYNCLPTPSPSGSTIGHSSESSVPTTDTSI